MNIKSHRDRQLDDRYNKLRANLQMYRYHYLLLTETSHLFKTDSGSLYDSPIRETVCELLNKVSMMSVLDKLKKSREVKGKLWNDYLAQLKNAYDKDLIPENDDFTVFANYHKHYKSPRDWAVKALKRSIGNNDISRIKKYSIERKRDRDWIISAIDWYKSLTDEKRKLACKRAGRKYITPEQIVEMSIDKAKETLTRLLIK